MTTATRLLRSFIRAVPLLLGAVFVLSLQPARASTWNHTQVDNTATTTGKNLSLAVDPAGKLYVGYLDTTNSNAPILKYANNASGSWVLEDLSTILPDATNASTATVFTPGGPRIMAYSYNSTLGKTMYRAARKVTGDGWQLQDIGGGISPLDGSIESPMTTVSSATQTGAVQYMGFTFITFNNGNYLQYANEMDMAWHQITNAGSGAGNGGIQSDLTVDSSKNIHVVYIDALNNLIYRKNPTSPTLPDIGTTLQVNGGTTQPVANPSIAVDSHGTIHVIYTLKGNKDSNSYVYYLSKTTTGNWSSAVSIGTFGKSGGYTTLKVDGADNVHAAWYRGDTANLVYNEKLYGSSSWVYTNVGDTITYTGNASTNYGQYAAMAIDQYNNVNIAYYDVTATSLDVVTKPNPAIDVSPSTVLFGYVPQYSSATLPVTIANKGNASLTVNTISAPTQANFTAVANDCTPLPKTLVAGASCTISYQFAPTIPGAQTATVSIGSTDPNTATRMVTLKGTATQPASHTITAGTMGAGGTISPAGSNTVPDGSQMTFTITPDPGYLVGMVMIDPVFANPQQPTMQEMAAASKGALTSYTFTETDTTTNHTILVYFTPYVAVSTWSTTEVDNTGTATGKNLSIAVDPNNKLHIGYLDTSSSTAPFLKYANNTAADGSWSLTSLQNILPNAMNASTSTVYTPGGPRVMAYSYDTATLKYKYQAARKLFSNEWQLQDIGGGINPMTGQDEPPMTTVSTATQTGALQYMGYTFITFNNGDYLQYANERDMAWYQISNAGSSAGNGGTQSDLAIDSSGNIHTVYVDALNNLVYRKNPTSPTLPVAPRTLVDSTGVITNPNIAIDANNNLHVIYLDANGYNVMYINSTSGGTTWSTPKVVGPAGNYGNYLSIKADNTGGVHIAYYYAASATTGLLMYNHILPSGAWGSEEILKDSNNSANYGQYPAIAIDNNNVVNIAYYDATRSSLKVATKQTDAIDASPSQLYFGNIAQGSSDQRTVTVTNKGTSGNLHIRGSATLSGANASDFAISNNTCTDGLSIAPGAAGCTVTVTFSPAASGAKTASLTIGSDDLLIPYKSVPLSGTSNASANYTIIAGVGGVGGTISPAGYVPVAGSDSQTFTFTPDPGFIVAFVAVDPVFADPQNPTQQEFMAASKGALASYTFNQVTGNHSIFVFFTQAIPVTSWGVTEVDNSATDTGKYCSITNAPNGKLYVGYLDTTSATAPLLKYATNRSGAWVYETVSTIPNVTAAGTATVFSEGIGPRVMAYSYNSTTGARKYGAARKWTEQAPSGGNLNDWQLQWIAGDYFPPQYGGGAQPPIFTTTTDTFTGATQYNGFTFITYADGNNLWYANEKDFYYLKLDPANSIAGAGKQSDLVLDAAGNINIIYYTPGAGGTGELRYGYGQGSNSTGYVESVIVTGISSDPSITIDGTGMLHVSYIQSGNVMYKNKPSGGAWSAPKTIGPCGANGAYTSIKANGLNIVHLTYYAYNSTNASGKLMYVTRAPDGLWSSPQAVTDSSANFGQYAALTVDDHHNVNIAYYDVTRTSLKVAARMIPVISAPSSVSFGSVTPNTPASQTINVLNAGQDTLRIGTVTKDGANASNFTIVSNNCNSTTLAPGDTIGCNINVVFTGPADGTYTAKLHITSNDRYTPDKQVTLSGTVTPIVTTHAIITNPGPGGSISPAGPVTVNDGADQSFTISANAGYYISTVTSDDPGMTCSPAIGILTNKTCILHNIKADHTISATFVQPFLLFGTSSFYGTLQGAYAVDGAGIAILGLEGTSNEDLIFDNPFSMSLVGGYDILFGTQIGATTFKSITVSNGTVDLNGFIFQ